MQTSDSKKVKRAGLLKWFLDVFRGLVPETEQDPTEKILNLRRVLQSSANCVLHPCARFLRETQDRVATAVPNQGAVLRITNKEHSTDVVTRKVRAHIEFARISGRRDYFRDSKQLQFVTKFRSAFPTNLPDGVRELVLTFEFD